MENDDEGKKLASAVIARFSAGSLPYERTVLSTCGSAMVLATTNPAGAPTWVMLNTADVAAIRHEIEDLFHMGYRFTVEDAKMTSSYHQDLLREAKSNLCEQILGRNPSPSVIMQTILNAGTALNSQLDQDSRAQYIAGIDNKLDAVGLKVANEPLFEKYVNLNPFYNSTKHEDRPATKRTRAQLEGLTGSMIATDYFETVRRVFLWYYEQKAAVPLWQELEPIDYSKFAISYTFNLSKRW